MVDINFEFVEKIQNCPELFRKYLLETVFYGPKFLGSHQNSAVSRKLMEEFGFLCSVIAPSNLILHIARSIILE